MKNLQNTYVTSDTHFWHENILRFDNGTMRPEFKSVHEMNSYIISTWSKRLKPGDTLIHLGDVFFGGQKGRDWCESVFPTVLEGVKTILVLGNHDNVKYMVNSNLFDEVYAYIKVKRKKFTISHKPLAKQQLREGMINIHGHIHNRPDIPGPYRNVSVEKTKYAPVKLTSLLK